MSHYSGSVPAAKRAADWRDAAACRAEEPDLFFPKGETGPWEFVINEAKAVCRRCPVVEQCLRWALEERFEHGIWGGLTESERRAVLRRRGIRIGHRGKKDEDDAEESAPAKPVRRTGTTKAAA